MQHTLKVPFEVLGDGDPVMEYKLEITLDYTPPVPEFIPPLDRPDMYDPGAGAEYFVTRVLVDGQSVSPRTMIWRWADKWLDENIDRMGLYAV